MAALMTLDLGGTNGINSSTAAVFGSIATTGDEYVRCTRCGFGGCDVRVVGCGCTLHAVRCVFRRSDCCCVRRFVVRQSERKATLGCHPSNGIPIHAEIVTKGLQDSMNLFFVDFNI